MRSTLLLGVLGRAFVPAVQTARRSLAASAFSVEEAVKAKDVVIFSKSWCPFCAKTKELFSKLEVDSDIYELDKVDGGADIQAELKEITGQTTVPNVFIKGQHLGGNDDVQDANASGKLAELLAA